MTMTNAQVALQAAVAYVAARPRDTAGYAYNALADQFYNWLENKDAQERIKEKGSVDERLTKLEEAVL